MSNNGVTWPYLQDCDYRFGFPIVNGAIDYIESLDEPTRKSLLTRLEQALFAGLVIADIATITGRKT